MQNGWALTLRANLKLPLGFMAGFFGMNNSVSTGNEWMTLNKQVLYMCKSPLFTLDQIKWLTICRLKVVISAIVVVIAISLAFSQRARATLSITTISVTAILPLTLMLPLAVWAEKLGLGSSWRTRIIHELHRLRRLRNHQMRRVTVRQQPAYEKGLAVSEGGGKPGSAGGRKDTEGKVNGAMAGAGSARPRLHSWRRTVSLHQARGSGHIDV